MRVWTWPVALGLLVASGLVSALVADGWGDAWAWFALGLPLVVAARFALRREAPLDPAPAPSSPSVNRSRP